MHYCILQSEFEMNSTNQMKKLRKARLLKSSRKEKILMEVLWKIENTLEDIKRNTESQPPPPQPAAERPTNAQQRKSPKPSGIARFEWPEEVDDDPIKPKWYRDIWAITAFVFLLALIPPTIVSALIGFMPQDWASRKLIYAVVHAIGCGYNAPGMFGVVASIFNIAIGMSLQKGEIRIPDSTFLFRECDLTPSKKRSLWAYISILVYHAFPKKFYEKVFQLNYKQLLEDLNQGQFLTNEEIDTLINIDIKRHKGKVHDWIHSLFRKNIPDERKFSKFKEELDGFQKKFFTPNKINQKLLIPIAKCILIITSICSVNDFTESGSTYDITRQFPVVNILGLFFLYLSFYIGVYTVDMYDADDLFFNEIREPNCQIKKKYSPIEKEIVNTYCQVDN
jgi:hypothetical protein